MGAPCRTSETAGPEARLHRTPGNPGAAPVSSAGNGSDHAAVTMLCDAVRVHGRGEADELEHAKPLAQLLALSAQQR